MVVPFPGMCESAGSIARLDPTLGISRRHGALPSDRQNGRTSETLQREGATLGDEGTDAGSSRLVCWICEKEITDKQSMLIVGGHTIHELCLQEVTAYQE